MCMSWSLTWCSRETPQNGRECVPGFFASSIFPFLFFLLGCLIQAQYQGFCLALLYPILFCLTAIFWRPALFLKRKWGVDLEKKGGVCWGPRRSGMRGNCDWDVLSEGRLFSTKQ